MHAVQGLVLHAVHDRHVCLLVFAGPTCTRYSIGYQCARGNSCGADQCPYYYYCTQLIMGAIHSSCSNWAYT